MKGKGSEVFYKRIDLGNGLSLTQSHDMGIFLHFCRHGSGVRLDTEEDIEPGRRWAGRKNGHGSGVRLDTEEDIEPGRRWAEEILSEVPNNESFENGEEKRRVF